MARLADEVVGRIKAEVSLVRLIEGQGHALKRHGKDYVLACPFHADATPSLVVSPATNLWHCLGCGAGGSVIDWVMKTQGVSFRLACELLQKDLGLALEVPAAPVTRSSTKKLPSPLAADADAQTALRQVIAYYHETLKQSPEALAYLDARGLNSPALIERFQLGFANRTLGYRLPEKNRKAGAEARGLLQQIGILRESGHEHFNGSLVVPVIDEAGVITEVYGRKVLDNLRAGTAYHLYLPGPHTGVWNPECLASREIILCESLIDAMTFWVHGFRHVTTSYGVSGFTDDHLAAFKAHGVERVLIAYDRDDAGNAAAAKLAPVLQAAGIGCYRVQFPKGMDANEYALKMSPADKALGLVLRKAEWMGGGEPPPLSVQSDATAAAKEEPAAAITEVLPLAAALAVPALDEAQHASPVPAVPAGVEAKTSDHETVLILGDRRYRVRGFGKNASYEQLKINLLVSVGERFHVDTLDVYSAKARGAFIRQAGIELGLSEDVLKTDLGTVLLKLEELQDRKLGKEPVAASPVPVLDADDEQAALALLRSPDLLRRILDDFAAAGVVGEETNTLVGYLAGVSRKLDRPLAVIIQSSSAAGKSSLMEAVLAMMPAEERVQYSAMTGQSLFYMGETNLKHKILAIAEEEGAHNASYALKLLQSDGVVTIASTGKDETTGDLVTREYRVEGPVMLFLTTTAIDIDEELLNRCLVLTVNESREQTAAIHALQRARQTLAGLLAEEDKKDVIRLHQNAQRLLKPVLVVNPYADQLTFLDDKTRTRRDHMKYLTLIRTVALLHQYQRPLKTVQHKGKVVQYIEVALSDIEAANALAHEVLGRTLDELPPQTRKLLSIIQREVKAACVAQHLAQKDYRFGRRDVRAWSGWGETQLRVHLERLMQMEHVLMHRGSRGQSFVYELLHDGDWLDAGPRLPGLIDVEALKSTATTASSRGESVGFAASSRGESGAIAAPVRAAENAENPEKNRADLPLAAAVAVNGHPTEHAALPSYRSDGVSIAAASA
ncbi:MAG: CHC2 zinc finger domain-containing protein [Pseudomonadota bacterium]